MRFGSREGVENVRGVDVLILVDLRRFLAANTRGLSIVLDVDPDELSVDQSRSGLTSFVS